jgi:hypothetical protein
MVAGTNHDHIFVPIDRASEAMSVLQRLQERGQEFMDQTTVLTKSPNWVRPGV